MIFETLIASIAAVIIVALFTWTWNKTLVSKSNVEEVRVILEEHTSEIDRKLLKLDTKVNSTTTSIDSVKLAINSGGFER